ncbi:MAG: 3-phosphoshikimate 1-carboxyvinyltransferase [Flavobacteriaceae bacterium]|jgi:3-phosphoshikimate 1-carboxyvinyltransferase|nr:3-phosphoshikimate 1-carboxyvinyltransferase [Flavobacteriaceae bacterium]
MSLYTFELSLPKSKNLQADIQITGSKSETNRLLLLQALFDKISISNTSNSDDAVAMAAGLKINQGEVDIHHAGTAMRFLTSYFASREGKEVILTGSKRMQERPIKILVDALRSLGASIEYTKNEGYPPLKITGKKLEQNKVVMAANVSSQYISSLLLIAPSLPNGLELHLEGKITSVPYIKMTLALLDSIGVSTSFEGQIIKVAHKSSVSAQELVVESDWSSASYFYSLCALADIGSQIKLSSYKKDSLQGDSVLAQIYTELGVETTYEGHSIVLKKISEVSSKVKNSGLVWDLANAPDIAQTIAVTCFGLGVSCSLTGLHTLKIKETDRLVALYNELSKFGAKVTIDDKSLQLELFEGDYNLGVSVATYNDHRMAMAFAPLALLVPFKVEDAMVVTKSFPDFWEDMQTIGIGVSH